MGKTKDVSAEQIQNLARNLTEAPTGYAMLGLRNRELDLAAAQQAKPVGPSDREEARLNALYELNLLDTPASESFDRITRMASRLTNMPIAMISLTDRDRQWFKSIFGRVSFEIPRLQAPCSEITKTGEPIVVPDLLLDPRFSSSFLAKSGIRFYAGVPLITSEGYTLGSMCVLDLIPRTISSEEMGYLHDCAAMVMTQINRQNELKWVDPLSGLPGRSQLASDLKDLERRRPEMRGVSILIDLTDPRYFHQMVSVLGTAYIDNLISASSQAIKKAVGGTAGLYQFNVISYVLILDEAAGEKWKDVVEKIAAALKSPIMCDGIPVVVNATFGISPFQLGAGSSDDALRTAVSAAYDAREQGFDYAVYSPASDEANRRRFTLLTDMREAVKQTNQLVLAFQPKVDLRSGECVSVEALLRWQHPTLGNVSPAEFIPLVEQTTLARNLTEWVLGAALDQAAAWRKVGINLKISINISPLNLEEPDFAERVGEALKSHNIPVTCFELEFTEGALIRNGPRVLRQLDQLRALGIDVAIDDFGTGYSTFSYLQDIPAKTVKLDKSFMRALDENPRDRMLVESMIKMAHNLGYRVVAEGVGTQNAYEFLRSCECDEVQGYLISHPLSAEELASWLRGRGTKPNCTASRAAEHTLAARNDSK